MNVDSYWFGPVLILLTVPISSAGLVLARRFLDPKVLISAHDISGNFLAIVGTMYAVLLGLIVIEAMEKFQRTAIDVEVEANQLSDIVYLGDRMPTEKRREIRAKAIRYATLVRDREWVTMARGEHDPESLRAVLDLMAAVRDWEPSSESEKAVYATAIVAATDLWNARRERIILCGQGIPNLEWFAVILGGIVTVGITYVFYFEDLRIQVGLTCLVCILVALNVYLIAMFGYPFSGDLKVSPQSFDNALMVFEMTKG